MAAEKGATRGQDQPDGQAMKGWMKADHAGRPRNLPLLDEVALVQTGVTRRRGAGDKWLPQGGCERGRSPLQAQARLRINTHR